ncbi:MAG: T9SS type A sorting domain-containing protein [Saprospiraceae bacterium]|nr:T9SS type A sorting domain-containing protein [Saprospiraceae bacterium]
MCTINSLDRIWQNHFNFSSIRTVLVILFLYMDSSGAHGANSTMAIQVTAPPDITINIKRPTICDTSFILPPAIFSGQCAGILRFSTTSIFTGLSTNGGLMYFTTGVYKVIYMVTDVCGMTGIDSTIVTVYDALVPNLVCAPQQTINLPSNGFADVPATIFDGGASDNCGHVYFKIKRMFAVSPHTCDNPVNPSNAFDDNIRFCCSDVDSNFIRVILRVYDVYPGNGIVNDSLHRGHYVDCMIQAIVRDKIAPDITCPYDVTVNCGADLDSVLLNMGPVIIDNCSLVNVDTLVDHNLDACGSGSIRRTFIAFDRYGQTSSCTQIITVNRVNTFNGLDPNQLKWPTHKIVFACRIDPDTINAGIPEIKEDGCANVLIAKRDEKYNFDRGGVCAKILRYWEVIDYCKYNKNYSPNPRVPENAYYSYIQEIKIMDTVAPVLSGLRDTVIGIQTPDCLAGNIILPDISASDCGSISNITIRYEIDFYNDGDIDRSSIGKNASGLFPIGSHTISFFANDSCHNTGILIINIEIIDSKSPNANAIYGLSSSLSLMPAGPMVSIHAKVFDIKSSDNCTPASQLRFSFSADVNDTLRIFNCDSLGKRDIHLVVWDLEGNSSEVITFITIDDVHNLCPTTLQGVQVLGQIQTKNQQMIKDAEVSLQYDTKLVQTMTDKDGQFRFNSIPQNKFIQLSSSCNQNFTAGITTADIIKIQRHILGIDLLRNAHELLAADVDKSQKITTKDVVLIRNLILGKMTEFPSHQSYLFLNNNYVFQYPEDPYAELVNAEKFNLETKANTPPANFTAIKLGDVNNSFTANNIQLPLQKTAILFYQVKNAYLEVYMNQSGLFNGFQFEFLHKGFCFKSSDRIESDLPGWNESNYKVEGNKLIVSYAESDILLNGMETAILRIPIETIDQNCNPYLYLGNSFINECYQQSEVFSIQGIEPFGFENTNQQDVIELFPNPFNENLSIRLYLTKENSMKLDLYSLDGKKSLTKTINAPLGISEITLTKTEIGSEGVFLLHIYNDIISKYYKIIAE